MLQLMVFTDQDGRDGCLNLPINEVQFITCSLRGRMLELRTETGVFYTTGTMDLLTEAFKKSQPNMMRVDRTSIVNLDNVYSVNEMLNLVYFSESGKNWCNVSVQGLRKMMIKLHTQKMPFLCIT